MTLSQFALWWNLTFDRITCAIPGGKHAQQVAEDCQASVRSPRSKETMEAARRIYEARIKAHVHSRR